MYVCKESWNYDSNRQSIPLGGTLGNSLEITSLHLKIPFS